MTVREDRKDGHVEGRLWYEVPMKREGGLSSIDVKCHKRTFSPPISGTEETPVLDNFLISPVRR